MPQLLDNFTDVDSTNVLSHTSDSGGTVTKLAGSSSSNTIITSNHAWGDGGEKTYLSTDGPAVTSGYYVEASVEHKTSFGVFSVIGCITDHDNKIYAEFQSPNIRLRKKVAGTNTTLYSAAHGLSTGTTNTIKLEITATDLLLYMNGVLLYTEVGDGLVRTASVGYDSNANTTSTGFHADWIQTGLIASVPPAPNNPGNEESVVAADVVTTTDSVYQFLTRAALDADWAAPPSLTTNGHAISFKTGSGGGLTGQINTIAQSSGADSFLFDYYDSVLAVWDTISISLIDGDIAGEIRTTLPHPVGSDGRMFTITSPDALATVEGANYFSDPGYASLLKTNDVIIVKGATGTKMYTVTVDKIARNVVLSTGLTIS